MPWRGIYRNALGSSPYEVIIEQPAWWGADGYQLGEQVWTAVAPSSNLWHLWRMWRHEDYATHGVDCRVIYGSYLCRCFEGAYFGPDSSNPAYSFPDGAWTAANTTAGVAAQYTYAKRWSITLPAGTKRLYMLPVPDPYSTTAAFSLTRGALVKPTWTFDSPGDFTAEPDTYDAWTLIATDCGGATLTIAPAGGGPCYIAGFIAVTDVPSNPYDGVFDPASMIPITPTHQVAPAVLAIRVAGAQGEGVMLAPGHWTATRTLAGDAESRYYENGGALAAWAPAARTHVRAATSQYVRVLTGNVTIDSPTPGVIGACRAVTCLTASGHAHDERYAFNAAAQAASVYLDASYNGGYGGMWGLTSMFSAARNIPGIGRTNAAAHDGNMIWTAGGDCVVMETPKYTALYGGQACSKLASGGVLPYGYCNVNSRSDLGGFTKAYHYWTRGGYAVQDGDEIGFISRRTLALRQAI